jgi:hypothetical protein
MPIFKYLYLGEDKEENEKLTRSGQKDNTNMNRPKKNRSLHSGKVIPYVIQLFISFKL